VTACVRVVGTQFRENAGDVVFGRSLSNRGRVGDLLVCVPCADQTKHIEFAGTQLIVSSVFGLDPEFRAEFAFVQPELWGSLPAVPCERFLSANAVEGYPASILRKVRLEQVSTWVREKVCRMHQDTISHAGTVP
jgi:hypothetical protein